MWVRSKTGCAHSKTQLARAAEFAIEALEARQLLSASATLNSAGLLSITGKTGSDTILVSLSPTSSAVLDVSVDGVTTTFATSAVKSIDITSVGGNTVMEIEQTNGNITVPVTMMGGTGNDTLVGGDGAEVLDGVTGDDLIISGSGSTLIVGGGGNNTIIAQNGDNIHAANGNNTINTGGSNSTLTIGNGYNMVNIGVAALATPMDIITPSVGVNNEDWGGGYSPLDMETAYQLPTAIGDTSGFSQTIVIVDAYDDPDILADVNTFSTEFDLPNMIAPLTTGTVDEPILNVVYSTTAGTVTTTAPIQDPTGTGGWEGEESLDVEWAHAAAPEANIILVETPSQSSGDLFGGVKLGASMIAANGGVLSMSWGLDEGTGGVHTGLESAEDSLLFDNAAYSKITFIASAGDDGGELSYPAMSPYVVSIGGTTLVLSAEGNPESETAWSSGGGGVSLYESTPAYQDILAGDYGKRAGPDIAFDADPNTGVATFDSIPDEFGDVGWGIVGGTSFGAPFFAGITAVINQLRATKNETPIGSGMLAEIYHLGSTQQTTDFYDVTYGIQLVGDNNTPGNGATVGWDLTTGWGRPRVSQFDSDVSGVTTVPVQPIVFDGIGITWSGSFTEPWSDDSFDGNSIVSSFTGNGTIFGSQASMTINFNTTAAYNNGDIAPIFDMDPGFFNGNSFSQTGTVTVAGPDEVDTIDILMTGTVSLAADGLPHITGQIVTVDGLGNVLTQGLNPIFQMKFSGGG